MQIWKKTTTSKGKSVKMRLNNLIWEKVSVLYNGISLALTIHFFIIWGKGTNEIFEFSNTLNIILLLILQEPTLSQWSGPLQWVELTPQQLHYFSLRAGTTNRIVSFLPGKGLGQLYSQTFCENTVKLVMLASFAWKNSQEYLRCQNKSRNTLKALRRAGWGIPPS